MGAWTMALAVIVTLEKELPSLAAYTKSKSGKALGRELERIDHAARSKKVAGPSALLSENPAALAAQLQAEGFDPLKMRIPPEQWFGAAEGLKTVRGLIEHITANLNNFKHPNPILRDLKAAETLLIDAETHGIGFHFTKVDV
jgi:hypothetical protein